MENIVSNSVSLITAHYKHVFSESAANKISNFEQNTRGNGIFKIISVYRHEDYAYMVACWVLELRY